MSDRLSYLFQRFLDKSCSPEERKELMGLALEAGLQDDLKKVIGDARFHAGEDEDMTDARADELMQKIFPEPSQDAGKLISIGKRKSWRRIAVAAAIVIAIGSGAYYMIMYKFGRQTDIVKTPELLNDVKPPATNRAMITLANGKTVYLDSAANGTLAMQESVQVVKLADGQIAYTGSAGEMMYNTLTNPRGSKVIDMALADGSHVWLNAGSSVTYPIAFIGNERKVSIAGEAYFEVAKDAVKKFLVEANSTTTEVLGTHFNINAFANEPAVKITLLEGSVNVFNSNGSATLKPGQQAIVTADNAPRTSANISIEEVMAWKNGLFEFNETDIQAIMRQLERWYDVEVVFDGTITQHFNGTIPRQVNASRVLGMLEKTGGVRFSIEGKKVVVKK